MADYRLRGLPEPLWRRVRARAGDQLRPVLLGLLRAYADGQIDPLAETPPSPAAALGALGGATRAARMTPEARSEAARAAVQARWARRQP